MRSYDVVAVGTVGRDVALRVDGIPGPGGSVRVNERHEGAGGTGAGIAVAAARRGATTALVGVVGDDDTGADVCRQLERDSVDTRHVIRRGGVDTPLLVGIVDATSTRRYLEDLPPGTALTPADAKGSASALSAARTVVISLRTPSDAAAEAAAVARDAGASVLVDGAPTDPVYRDCLLHATDVVRADTAATAAIAGSPLTGVDDAIAAARSLLARGPSLVALSIGAGGNVLVWDSGYAVFPLEETRATDPVAAGDAFTAALAMSLMRGESYRQAGRAATQAASAAGQLTDALR